MKNKIAKITGRALQDDKSFKMEGGFVPERDQFYFELQKGDDTFYLGFKDILYILKTMEKMEEIPEIETKWWKKLASLYGEDILMVDYKENSKEITIEGD